MADGQTNGDTETALEALHKSIRDAESLDDLPHDASPAAMARAYADLLLRSNERTRLLIVVVECLVAEQRRNGRQVLKLLHELAKNAKV